MSSARKLRLVHSQTTEFPARQARTRTTSRTRQSHHDLRPALQESMRVLEAHDYEVVYVERRSSPVFEAALIDIEDARKWMEAPALSVEAEEESARAVVRHTLPPRGNTTITMAPLARTKAALAPDERAIIALPEDRRRTLWGFGLTLSAFIYAAWALIP